MEGLGISFSAAVLLLIALYFVIKWAVRNAIDESKSEIAKAVKKGMAKYEAQKNGAPPEEPEEEE